MRKEKVEGWEAMASRARFAQGWARLAQGRERRRIDFPHDVVGRLDNVLDAWLREVIAVAAVGGEVRFGRHEQTDGFAGGLSALAITANGSDPADRVIEQVWFSMAGAVLSEQSLGPWPTSARLVDLVGRSGDPTALLVRDNAVTQLWMADKRLAVDVSGMDEMALIEDGRGTVQLRALVLDGPIVQKTLEP